MKQLLIVRHAKSSWDHPGLEDYQRPLQERGKKKIRYVLDFLLKEKAKPDLILSSHATRALDTAKIIAHALDIPVEKIIISKNIYHGDADSLFNHFYDLSDEIKTLMIVGHNPSLTYFSNYFLDKKIENLPTSGVVGIEFKTDSWNQILKAKRKVRFVISPNELIRDVSRKQN
ncbi:MAG: SixA phosphatase family protein [Bacteroidales bacterium]